MLNFKCQARPEMEPNVGNGVIGRMVEDVDEDDYESSDSLSALSILDLLQGWTNVIICTLKACHISKTVHRSIVH